MKLRSPLLRLPLRFDASRLESELAALPEDVWGAYTSAANGAAVVPLVAGGDEPSDALTGSIAPPLERLAYVRQVLASLGAVVGRTRLIRVPPGAEAPLGPEAEHYLHGRARVHVPIVTRPEVRFHCGPAQAQMSAGSCWVVDTWRPHRFENPTDAPRVHLVIETVGSRYFWELVDRAPSPEAPSAETSAEHDRLVAFKPGDDASFPVEAPTAPTLMSPFELSQLARFVADELSSADPETEPSATEARAQLAAFEREWMSLWVRHGDDEEHRSAYQRVAEELLQSLQVTGRALRLANGIPLLAALQPLILRPALGSARVSSAPSTPARARAPRAQPVPEAAAQRERPAPAPPAASAAVRPVATAEQLRSVHTQNLPSVFRQLGISLLVTTYQSGHLIAIRADGDKLNTHFRTFRSPMGIAVRPDGFALGTHDSLWLYRNQPSVAPRVQPPKPYDACFLPHSSHVTGDIRIHDVAFGATELWIVNTKFSCLATIDRDNSFVPRWRPPFVSALAAEDRCHLNGLAMLDGQPRYVTALGTTDTAGGWRADRAHGGVILEVPSGRVVARGLSMPHSPRMYRGELYFLESGDGSIAKVDVATGEVTTLARLPGFTRGLAFAGPIAFVGLSQVRETNVFGGIPLTERIKERLSGVWAVHIETREVLGFLRFDGQVQEIFDVQVLHAKMPEIIALGSELAASSFVVPTAALEGGR